MAATQGSILTAAGPVNDGNHGCRRVREVWLFGSLARGHATPPRRDADLLIVLDEDVRRRMDRIPEFLLLRHGVG